MSSAPKNHRLVVFTCVSAGLNGPDLGSDEAEVILMVYVILDPESKQIVGCHKYPVRPESPLPSPKDHDGSSASLRSSAVSLVSSPSVASAGNANEAGEAENAVDRLSEDVKEDDENENTVDRVLLHGDELRKVYGLTDQVLAGALSLEAAIRSFDEVVQKNGFDPLLVTNGQLQIRQCLFPEASRKNIRLPAYYHHFRDLKKDYSAAMAGRHSDNNNGNKENDQDTLGRTLDENISIEEMLQRLDINVAKEDESDKATEDARAMAQVVLKFISDGVVLNDPDYVQSKLEQGLLTREDQVDANCCVRARGLPWQASDQDIAKFFVGLNIAKGGVALCLSNQGRRNGEALILFEDLSHRDMGLRRHKHHIGNRYIEVYKATGEDFISVAGGNNKDAQQFLSRAGKVIIRMRGLPYDATSKQIIEFFASGENQCSVLDSSDGVLFVRRADGRATGDAFVQFAEEEEGNRAIQKHKEVIGSRYIELFRSTTAEVQQVLNRMLESQGQKLPSNGKGILSQPPCSPGMAPQQQLPLISQISSAVSPVFPQQIITSGNRKDCIRLRGLPYEAQVEHILDFLGEHAQTIIFQGVHMVYNAQGHPSGEAFIQMATEQAAFSASQNRHHKYMGFGKKQRYIEVFQCSGEDMNLVLTGNTGNSAASLMLAAQAAQNMMGNAAGPGMSLQGTPQTTPQDGKPYNGGCLLPAAAGMLTLPSPTFNATAPPNAQAQAQQHFLDYVTNSLMINPLLNQQLANVSHMLPAALAVSPRFPNFGASNADPNSAWNALASAGLPADSSASGIGGGMFGGGGWLPSVPSGITPAAFLPVSAPNSRFPFTYPSQSNLPLAASTNPYLRLPAAANSAAAIALQTQQTALLQSQLAAQRLLLSQSVPISLAEADALAASQANSAAKRSYGQAFSNSALEFSPQNNAKRAGLAYGSPTISAGPTTYPRGQQNASE